MTRLTSSIIHSPHSRTLQSLMPSWLQELVSVPTNPCVVQFSPPIAVVVAAKVPASSHPLTERSTLAGEYARAIETMAGLGSPSTSICCSGNGSRSEPLGYGAEEPPAFCPRTHAAMIFQSGSSRDVNCLPPWWVSAMPPTSGASGISSNRLVKGLPGVTSFETI